MYSIMNSFLIRSVQNYAAVTMCIRFFIGLIYPGKLRSLSLTTTDTTLTMFLQVSLNLIKQISI